MPGGEAEIDTLDPLPLIERLLGDGPWPGQAGHMRSGWVS